MTILIKGMEMPKAGETIIIAENVDRTIYGRLEHGDDWYPLIEVPTPHGRLVDADEVAAQLQEMSEVVEDAYPLDKKERQLGIERGLRDARRFIVELAPTVIEAEK